MDKKTILIADDDKDIVEIVSLYVEREGYEIIEAYDGNSAWRIIQESKPDLAVLDIMMPGLDGLQLVKKLRTSYNLPVIILSARGEDHHKILGLGLGADDYMAKPFNPLELVARIQAQLRRSLDLNKALKQKEEEKLVVGDMVLDKSSCVLYKRGSEIYLTSVEYKLLALFMEHPGRVYTKGQIFEYVWGEYLAGDDNTIMVHISKLREKLEDDPKNPRYIKTIRGLGYRFEKKVLP